MKFIDLFAGLGGFHKALHELGHECVFVSELDPALREVYQENWGIEVHGDIKKVPEKDIVIIPKHDILCAGFPCQPFSKAGNQLGRDDDRGTFFFKIAPQQNLFQIADNYLMSNYFDIIVMWKFPLGTCNLMFGNINLIQNRKQQFVIPLN